MGNELQCVTVVMTEKKSEDIDMIDTAFFTKIEPTSQTYYGTCLNVCVIVFVLWNSSYNTVEKYSFL